MFTEGLCPAVSAPGAGEGWEGCPMGLWHRAWGVRLGATGGAGMVPLTDQSDRDCGRAPPPHPTYPPFPIHGPSRGRVTPPQSPPLPTPPFPAAGGAGAVRQSTGPGLSKLKLYWGGSAAGRGVGGEAAGTPLAPAHSGGRVRLRALLLGEGLAADAESHLLRAEGEAKDVLVVAVLVLGGAGVTVWCRARCQCCRVSPSLTRSSLMKSPACPSVMPASCTRMCCTVCSTSVAIVTSPQTYMCPALWHSTRCTSAASCVRRTSCTYVWGHHDGVGNDSQHTASTMAPSPPLPLVPHRHPCLHRPFLHPCLCVPHPTPVPPILSPSSSLVLVPTTPLFPVPSSSQPVSILSWPPPLSPSHPRPTLGVPGCRENAVRTWLRAPRSRASSISSW